MLICKAYRSEPHEPWERAAGSQLRRLTWQVTDGRGGLAHEDSAIMQPAVMRITTLKAWEDNVCHHQLGNCVLSLLLCVMP